MRVRIKNSLAQRRAAHRAADRSRALRTFRTRACNRIRQWREGITQYLSLHPNWLLGPRKRSESPRNTRPLDSYNFTERTYRGTLSTIQGGRTRPGDPLLQATELPTRDKVTSYFRARGDGGGNIKYREFSLVTATCREM